MKLVFFKDGNLPLLQTGPQQPPCNHPSCCGDRGCQSGGGGAVDGGGAGRGGGGARRGGLEHLVLGGGGRGVEGAEGGVGGGEDGGR